MASTNVLEDLRNRGEAAATSAVLHHVYGWLAVKSTTSLNDSATMEVESYRRVSIARIFTAEVSDSPLATAGCCEKLPRMTYGCFFKWDYKTSGGAVST